jgi:streptogramin lyase
MHAMGALLSAETMAALPAILAAGLDGTYDRALPPPALPNIAVAKAHIVEWSLGAPGSYVHDLALGKNGWIYAVDMNLDRIEAIDTATATTKTWAIPDRGHPRGGYLRGAAQPVGTTSARQAPHSVEYGEDGRLWITHALGSEIAAFDPSTGEMQHWSLPRGSYYPHTLRVRGGSVWFTVTLTNQLGRLDTSKNGFELLPLAASTVEQRLAPGMLGATFGLASFWPGEDRQVDFNLTRLSSRGGQVLPAPYGIDRAPDGRIYFTQLYGNRLGRYDPRTGTLEHWPTPFVGPRRLAVAPDGRVWIPAFGSNLLAVFDPASHSFRTFALPCPPPIEDAPYAVNVQPTTGDVWVTSTTEDVLYRFDPRAESFIVYPLPTRGAFMREIEFGPAGEVCTTYSNLPDYHMPDPGVKLMCLFPEDT